MCLPVTTPLSQHSLVCGAVPTVLGRHLHGGVFSSLGVLLRMLRLSLVVVAPRHTCRHRCVCVCVYIYVHTHTYIYIYVYIYIYILCVYDMCARAP